jgi:hypothetical protein
MTSNTLPRRYELSVRRTVDVKEFRELLDCSSYFHANCMHYLIFSCSWRNYIGTAIEINVMWYGWLRTGFGLVNEFIGFVVTDRNYTSHISLTHTIMFSVTVFTSILVTASNFGHFPPSGVPRFSHQHLTTGAHNIRNREYLQLINPPANRAALQLLIHQLNSH